MTLKRVRIALAVAFVLAFSFFYVAYRLGQKSAHVLSAPAYGSVFS